MHSVLNHVDTYSSERKHMQTDTGTNGATRKRRTAVGRKDEEGQEQVIKLDKIKSSMSELVELYKKAEDSADSFATAIKDAAEKGGILAATLRKFVVAKAGEKYEEKKRACAQLSLLFEEVGD